MTEYVLNTKEESVEYRVLRLLEELGLPSPEFRKNPEGFLTVNTEGKVYYTSAGEGKELGAIDFSCKAFRIALSVRTEKLVQLIKPYLTPGKVIHLCCNHDEVPPRGIIVNDFEKLIVLFSNGNSMPLEDLDYSTIDKIFIGKTPDLVGNTMHKVIDTKEFKFHLTKKYFHSEDRFHPGEHVLVRDTPSEVWKFDIYRGYTPNSEYPHECMTGVYGFVIPYRGNEHLYGTTNREEQ